MRRDKLDLKRIQLLESLPRWSWDALDDKWNDGFEYLKKYFEEQGHARVPPRFKYEDFNLGVWVGTQRQGKNKLDLERIKMLESLPRWSWDALEDKWNDGFEYLKKYIEEYGHARVPQGLKYEDFNLGAWVGTQRQGKNKLDLEKIQLLEGLPQWTWDPFEQRWNEGFEYLKKYIEEYGHARVPLGLKYGDFSLGSWVSHRRRDKGKLDLEKIKMLESLPRWSWDALVDQWNEGFEYLKKYVEEYGHARVPFRFQYEDFNLGSWIGTQRQGKNKLDFEKIQLLEELPQWSWNPFEDQWNKGFEYLKKYVEEQGHARVPLRFKYENFNLGAWVSSQRKTMDKLDLERIQLLEALPQWSWDILEDQWNIGFEYLKKYVEEQGHARVYQGFQYEDFNLGSWVGTQRKDKGKLDFEKIKMLESLPRWSWNPFEDQWNKGFEYLKKYVEEQGHARVPLRFKYENFNLGSWVSHRRKDKGKLDSERIKMLESLPRWSWDALEDQWNEGFEYLKKYVEEYGHVKVPFRFKYEEFNLGSWVGTQRKDKGKLDLERIKMLESLPRWSWSVKSE